MPVVYHKKHRYILHWLKEWDAVLWTCHEMLRGYNKKNLFHVDWVKARQTGVLDTLPKSMTNRMLSKRLTHLIRLRDGRINYPKTTIPGTNTRKRLYKDIPKYLKERFRKVPSRSIWSDKAIKVALKLTSKYRKGKFTDWRRILEDPRSKVFPYRDVARLRRYWRTRVRNMKPKIIRQRRKYSREYKKIYVRKHTIKSKRTAEGIRRAKKESVNEFLRSLL